MEKYNHAYFIGIGGIGMSGLARLFLHEGIAVSGSDIAKSANIEKLEEQGAEIRYAQEAANIGEDIDVVIYTEAIAKDNPEFLEAQRRGIATMNYFQALGMVANEYYLIAVSGTHGKTTTTAMLIDILEEASYDPTAIVGSLRSKTGSNYRAGRSKYFIVEACEYRRDFLSLSPDVLIITNIELEHVDYYKDLASVQAAFRELALKVPEDGAIIVNGSDPALAPVVSGALPKIIDYRDALDLSLPLRLPGMHNRMNAAAARAAAEFLGIETSMINVALANFAGTARRFEYKGDCNGAHVYDDYGHHPSEIMATIAGARELYPKKKITLVFQPHTFSRTQELFEDFVHALGKADRILMLPVYAARKEDGYLRTSDDLVRALCTQGIDAVLFQTLPAAAEAVREGVSENDVVLVMGAGDVTNVAKLLTH